MVQNLVNDLGTDVIHREDVVVHHVILVTVVVRRLVGLPVVRRINVDAPVENVSRGISSINMGDKGIIRHGVTHLSPSAEHGKREFALLFGQLCQLDSIRPISRSHRRAISSPQKPGRHSADYTPLGLPFSRTDR